jgi:hypothetical protein
MVLMAFIIAVPVLLLINFIPVTRRLLQGDSPFTWEKVKGKVPGLKAVQPSTKAA